MPRIEKFCNEMALWTSLICKIPWAKEASLLAWASERTWVKLNRKFWVGQTSNSQAPSPQSLRCRGTRLRFLAQRLRSRTVRRKAQQEIGRAAWKLIQWIRIRRLIALQRLCILNLLSRIKTLLRKFCTLWIRADPDFSRNQNPTSHQKSSAPSIRSAKLIISLAYPKKDQTKTKVRSWYPTWQEKGAKAAIVQVKWLLISATRIRTSKTRTSNRSGVRKRCITFSPRCLPIIIALRVQRTKLKIPR